MESLHSLIITTSNNNLGDATDKTGVWLEELATPYFIFKDGGEFITIVSPHGGQIPLNPNSNLAATATENTIRFEKDAQAIYHFSHSLPINEVKAENFDLIFLGGGYGGMWDFVNNKKLKKILEDFNRQNKPIGLVGHGVGALIPLRMNNGEPLVKGKKLTAFSNSEEELSGLNKQLPFLLETKLKSLGALYSKGPDFTSYVVADDNIITGQNAASSIQTARLVLTLAHRKKKLRNLKASEKLIQRTVSGDKRIY